MASNIEIGHAKNVANFSKLVNNSRFLFGKPKHSNKWTLFWSARWPKNRRYRVGRGWQGGWVFHDYSFQS